MGDSSKFNSAEEFVEDLRRKIQAKDDFVVKTEKNMKEAVAAIRTVIEAEGLRCRVYTKRRGSAAATAVVGGTAVLTLEVVPYAVGLALFPYAAVIGLAGIAASLGIAAHRIATKNPDYEVIKSPLSKEIFVKYKTRIDVSSR